MIANIRKLFWPAFQRFQDFRERLLPRPFERIALQGSTDLVGAEIGVLEGEHALLMLRSASIRKLFLVDPYVAYNERDQPTMDRAFRKARSKLRRYEQVRFVKDSSEDAARLLPELDFAYIDGDHRYEAVRKDIEVWWPKIKPGGILGGHDFANGLPRGWMETKDNFGVVQAVTEFAVHNHLFLRCQLSDWWIEKPTPK